MTMPTSKVTFPAFGIGEEMAITAPVEWHARISALSPLCLYGPNYSRHVVDTLVSLHYAVRDGYLDYAAELLAYCEEVPV